MEGKQRFERGRTGRIVDTQMRVGVKLYLVGIFVQLWGKVAWDFGGGKEIISHPHDSGGNKVMPHKPDMENFRYLWVRAQLDQSASKPSGRPQLEFLFGVG